MMKTIFRRSEFVLCDVPVPQGYPQSQTHSGIALHNGKYYLTTSPYPNPRYSKFELYFRVAVRKLSRGLFFKNYRGEDYENPCLYVGSDETIPTKFHIIEGSPLMTKPKDVYGLGSYCSDPDIFIEGDEIYVLNRESLRKSTIGTPEERYITSTFVIKLNVTGTKIHDKTITPLFNEQFASPCLTKYNDVFIYTCIDTNSYNTGEPCKAIYIRKSDSIERNWSEKCKVELIRGEFEPWHMSLFQHNGVLYTIIACVKQGDSHRCWQMLGEFSSDLSSLKIYQTPLTDYKSYRGAACVRGDGEFILYSTTVHEKIKGGRSVDGREVIMAHMPFKDLLRQLRENE